MAMIRVKYIGETVDTIFTKDKKYNVHMHDNCFHIIDNSKHHFIVISAFDDEDIEIIGKNTCWFFKNFKPAYQR